MSKANVPQHLKGWLDDLGIAQYHDLFVQHAIGVDTITELTDGDLKEIGVLLGDRRRILRAGSQIRKLSQADAGQSIRPATEDAAERRHLSVLFCDLVGSTHLSARHDPEDMQEIIHAFQDACAGVVARYDGFVAKLMGDGVLVYFGYPRAHEGDAERAVRGGLDMTAAVSRLRTRDGVSLQTRTGIATGLVVVGNVVGHGTAQEQTVVGDAPNLAARLQGLAAPGTVVVADSTRRLLGRFFEVQDLGQHDIKGFPDPIRAWRVAGITRFKTRFESERAVNLSPFVGRVRETELLSRCWDAAQQGKGQIVLVSGEAGIGKSRLVLEFEGSIAQRAYRRLSYQCLPYGTTSALHPFIDQIRTAAAINPDDPIDTQLDRLEAMLNETMSRDEAVRVAPLFAHLLSIPAGQRYPELQANAPQVRRQTFAALLDLMECAARRQPLMLLFEDLHWADASSIEVINLAVERFRHFSILALVTCRPEFDAPWSGLAHVINVTLGRLEATGVEALVESLSSIKLPESLIQQISTTTDGVPLFVEELTKMVLELNLAVEGTDQHRPLGSVASIGIPATLQDSMLARLDHLAPVRNVAQVAAAIGREFSYALLQAVADCDAPTLDTALARLEEAALLFRISGPPNGQYRFKHILVQNAAYETMLNSRRRVLHKRIADALCDVSPLVAETEPEVIAHHLSRAGLTVPAVEWWNKAGQRALQRSAHVEAIAHYSNATELVDGAPDAPLTPSAQLRLQIAYCQALIAAHSHGASVTVKAFARASELVAQVDEPAERFHTYYGLWAGSHVRGELSAARTTAAAFLADIRRGPPRPQAGLAYRALGTTHWSVGELPQAREHLEHALLLHDPEGNSDLCVQYGLDPGVGTLMQLAIVVWQMGGDARSLALSGDGVLLAVKTRHTPTIAYAYGWRCLLATLRADDVTLVENARRLTELSVEHKLSVWQSLGSLFLGYALRGEDRSSRLTDMRDIMASFRDQGFKLYLTFFPSLLAQACARAGHVEEAGQLLQEALEQGQTSGQRWYEAELYRQLAVLAVRDRSDGLPAAERYLELALSISCLQKARSFELRAAMMLAKIYGSTDRWNMAQALRGRHSAVNEANGPANELATMGHPFPDGDLE